MPLDQLRNVNFGKNRANATGSTGVGYTLMDVSGSVTAARTTTGVYQLTSGSGLYAAYISFPDDFRGQVLWDTGTAFADTCYATEEYNVEANNPLVRETFTKLCAVSGSIQTIYHLTAGRWYITGSQMIFYQDDGVTECARFNLFDQDGLPSSDCVFERVLTGSIC